MNIFQILFFKISLNLSIVIICSGYASSHYYLMNKTTWEKATEKSYVLFFLGFKFSYVLERHKLTGP